MSFPPFSQTASAQYPPVSVALLRPCISFYGPRFALISPPPFPLQLGHSITLEVRYQNPDDQSLHIVNTGVHGTLFAIESFAPDHVELVLCNDGPGHPYAYLIASLDPRMISLPNCIYVALSLLRPFLHCTYWQGSNVRPSGSIQVTMQYGVNNSAAVEDGTER